MIRNITLRTHYQGIDCHPRSSGPRTWLVTHVTCYRCKKRLKWIGGRIGAWKVA